MNDEILINQLFAGTYLNEGANIGHEVINLFKDDSGNNYLYITPGGKIDMNFHPVKSVLFVRNIEGKTTVEVIAKAEELAEADVDPKSIEYAKTPLSRVFANNKYHNDDDSNIFFTFKAGKIRMPKNGRRIFLTINNQFRINDDNIFIVKLKSNSNAISNQSGRKYYSQKNDPIAYNQLQELMNNNDYWEPTNTTEKLIMDGSTYRENPTFLDIIRKENDELVFSNLLAHYFEYDKTIFQEFVKNRLGIDDFSSQFEIIRESVDNIDLLIKDAKHVLVIENKIKSDINGIRNDGSYSQLNKYQDKIKERIHDPEDRFNLYGKKPSFYIFTPNYNHIDISKYKLEKPYKIITYKEIYNFFQNNATSFISDKYFSDFLRGLERHTMSMAELNFSIMRSRFFERINNA